MTEEKPLKSKKGLYRITDEFCRFWLKFVFPRRGELEIDRRDVVLNDIKVGLSQHLSAVYEKISMELLSGHMDMFFPFTKIGKWWDKGEEIDIIGINPDLNSILFGEVKWTGRPGLKGLDFSGGNLYMLTKQICKFRLTVKSHSVILS